MLWEQKCEEEIKIGRKDRYDPAVGDSDAGIEPETAFEDIPDDWVCPICGLGKDVFVPVED